MAQDKSLTITIKIREGANASLSANKLTGSIVPLAGVEVSVFNKETNELIQKKTSGADGNVTFKLDLFKAYSISTAKNGFVPERLTVIASPKGKERKAVLHIDGGEYFVLLYTPDSDRLSAELLDKPFTRIIYYGAENDFGVDPNSFFIDYAFEKSVSTEAGKLSTQSRSDAYRKLKQQVDSAMGKILIKEDLKETTPVSTQPVLQNTRNLSGILLSIVNNLTQPVSNTKIRLVGETGKAIEEAVTNEFGSFVFIKAPTDQNFSILLPDKNPKLANAQAIITDLAGKEIISTSCNAEGVFRFEFLKQDEIRIKMMEVEETVLKLDLKGKLFKNSTLIPLSNTKISLLNENQQLIKSSTTDNSGNFKFENVPHSKSYSISSDANGADKIILADENGVEIREYKAGNLTATVNLPLLPAEQLQLSYMSVDDPWLKFVDASSSGLTTTTVIPEKVYFALRDFNITREGKVILDKVIWILQANQKIKVEVDSHTDSQGTKEFNQELSNKRAKSAVDYIIAHGIVKERVTGVGFGETKPINNCTACTEEQNAQNRRIDFLITPLK
jgi:outer membrane protein OmpA-like peptidoglycan-associated protein